MDASDALVALALDFLAAGKTEEAMAALQKLLDMAPVKVEVNAPADPFMMDEAKRKMSELVRAKGASADLNSTMGGLSRDEGPMDSSRAAWRARVAAREAPGAGPR